MDIIKEQTTALLKVDNSGSVYEHIKHIVLHIAKEKPKNAYEDFESISRYVKETTFKGSSITDDGENFKSEKQKVVKQWLSGLTNLMLEPRGSYSFALPDVASDMNIFQNAGLMLSNHETILLSFSQKKLASSREGLVCLRFWGKIFGLLKDYYILEGKIESEEQVTDELNRFTYWCCSDLISGSWYQLPDVTANNIQQARLIKKYFTGEPKNHICSHPKFRGAEENLLRAQIARIYHSTTVGPTGCFTMDESGEVKESPKEERSAGESLSDWTHLANDIEFVESEEPALSKSPASDKPLLGTNSAWAFRVLGDDENAITCVRSLRWPGAVTTFQHFSTKHLYIGYGLKRDAPYYPSGQFL
eukprot:GHVL01008750.1.p1 GENE.GHVL01008750.1~~GHVL01008750.1.p1  ORF type:complete len:372 (+),score=58.58 GHVL01008750.1:35-1117(+)